LLIFQRLKHNLVSNNILVSGQYGFRGNVSTESATFKLTDSILRAWNNKEYVMGLFCDLTKAFDCVSHELLISKLEFYGVNGSILNCLKSYLYNRKQRVLLKFDSSPNIWSDWETIRHGVPQGSVLGSLLFNVHINDFPCIIGKVSHTILFADDTNILVSCNDHTELNSKLNKVFCYISEWFQNNQLVLNLNKTQFINFISSKSSTTHYRFHIIIKHLLSLKILHF
jgi:hypothetical protein